MDTLFYVLLARVLELLAPPLQALNVPANVSLGRVRPLPLNELPHVGVFLTGGDTLGEFGPQNLNVLDWDLTFNTEVAVFSEPGQSLDATHLAIMAVVHNTLMTAAPTLGLAFCSMLYPTAFAQPVLSQEAEFPTANVQTEWSARVRTSITDLTVAG